MKDYIVAALGLVLIGGAFYYVSYESTPMLTLTSPAFQDNQPIPMKYTCDADRKMSPPLAISGVPNGTKSLVLIVDDPDVPKALKPDGVFDHWVVYGIDPQTSVIPEGAVLGAQGMNGRGEPHYTGPCPPPEYEPTMHHYVFTLYATDIENLNFIKAPTKADLLGAIENHVIEKAVLIGTYDRKK